MRYFYLLILFFATSTGSVLAQSKATERADDFYDQLRYTYAAEAYEKLIDQGVTSTHIHTNLANCYYFNSNFEKAEENYAKVISNVSDPEILYRYAQTLKSSKKYEKSAEVMNRFAAVAPEDKRAILFKSNPDYVNEILSREPYFDLKLLSLNTESSDFASIEVGGKIYFSSSRNEDRKKYGWNDEPYLDIYEVEVLEDGTLGPPRILQGDVNSKYHEGTLDLTPDQRFMFFTRVDYFSGDLDRSRDGETKLNIYRALNAGGKWLDIQVTDLDSKEHSVGHPSISKDGKTIYFASDAPGGYGDSDIYKALLVDGIIYEPENLGPEINTSGRDSFPFIADDGALYFSSNGHPGLGGLDVFKFKNGKVTNMGQPINSNFDDFAFSYKPKKERGYLSSNRTGGNGNDDVYAVVVLIVEVDVTVVAKDIETGLPLEGAVIGLIDASDDTQPTQIADAEGKAFYVMKDPTELTARAAMEGYESGKVTLDIGKKTSTVMEVFLTPITDVEITVVAKNIETGLPIEGATINLRDKNDRNQPAQTSDTDGKAFFTMEDPSELIALGSKSGYEPGEASLIINPDENEANKTLEVFLTPNPFVVEVPGLPQIVLNDILFDFDKSVIRPDAAIELDKIVDLMNEYPNTTLVADTYADVRGSKQYNLQLTDRRSKSIIKYLISQGIDPDRLSGEGKGEADSLYDCNNNKCTEEQYQASRRSKFTFSKMK